MNDDSASDSDKILSEFRSAPPIMNGDDSKTLNSSPDETVVNVQDSNKLDSVNYRRLPKASWRYTFSSLSNPGFLYLWVSMITMMAGMQMQMLARGYLIYDITGSASLLGIVNAAHALPMLGLALFGGAIADRFERKRLIQIGQIVPAALALGIGITIFTNNIQWYHLMFVSIIQGSMFSFMMPARQAIIPQLVGKESLSNAMAINAAGMSVMTLVAPAIAGILYAWTGPANVYFVIAALNILAVVFTVFVPKTGTVSSASKGPILGDIAAGLTYIKQTQIVRILLIMGLATTLLAMPFRFLMPVFVVDVYNKGPESMGLLIAIMGGGSLVGSLFIASIGQWRRGMILIIGSFFSALALLLLAFLPFYFAAAAIMILLGLGDAGRRTINQSLVMEKTDTLFQGRVMSVFMMNFGLMPLGVLPAGMLIDIVGGQVVIGLLGLVLLIFTFIILFTQKNLRNAS
jgi:MFS family permease